MSERLFIEFMTNACKQNDVDLEILSDGWLLRMRKDDTVRLVVGSSFDMNTQASFAAARDKAATSALLERTGVSHVQHIVLRSADSASLEFIELKKMFTNGDVVIKPLDGEKGNLVKRVSSVKQAEDILKQYPTVTWAASPFVDIACEYRIVMVSDEVKVAYVKTDPVLIDNLKFFNLSKGAIANPLKTAELPADIRLISAYAMKELGLEVAAIDIIEDSMGNLSILEINASFSLVRYAQKNPATYSEVAGFYNQLVELMFTT